MDYTVEILIDVVKELEKKNELIEKQNQELKNINIAIDNLRKAL